MITVTPGSEHSDLAKATLKKAYLEGVDIAVAQRQYPMLGYSEQELTNLDETRAVYARQISAQETAEGEQYASSDPQKVGTISITPTKFTQSTPVTEEAIRYGGQQWMDIVKGTRALAVSAETRIDQEAIKILTLGFGTTYRVGADGLALFSNSHTLLNGDTNDNHLGALPLNYENYVTAETLLRTQKESAEGLQLSANTNLLLVVGEYNKKVAEQIVGAPGIYSSANNALNPNMGTKVMVSSYLTGSYAYNWFLIDLNRAKDMFELNVGWMPRFTQDDNPSKGIVFTNYISTQFSFDFTGHQWVVGSNATTS